ncbi:ATP-binding protein [Cytophagaceae bacterium YF14B1]|uniref:ATP-binding protein n=1 Tax=Xanthocytophaga flava TaxID=3048013 RepID=A0AAE3U8M2_9BACT|nr:ATP-binding protein [Xanthocytophaga flavus]MDJ1483586.1 ATP-binding protein [Xanthocytophaga flavus]
MVESTVLSPHPVLFIKSISEQGYSLSTAIADLIDNSIAARATHIDILADASQQSLKIFIADNGLGMVSERLTSAMRFPSADVDDIRAGNDLGRFGLGLKTASFSQSRSFTVISRTDISDYAGRTWDVEYLKKTDNWSLIIESQNHIEELLSEYKQISNNFHGQRKDFNLKTLIIWRDLYKLERLRKRDDISDELEDLRSHIGLVFHRFIQSGKITIRLNNSLIEAFDPFPLHCSDVQKVSENFWKTGETYIRFEGIILPKRSAQESREPNSIWASGGRTLEELQGIYVYRNKRLINFGGWLRTITKSSYLQFGRIKIDITNINDSEFHLNVAKSSLKIPFELKRAMTTMVSQVAEQATKEYRERLASNVIKPSRKSKGLSLIIKETGAAGPRLKINPDFEVLRQLQTQIDPESSGRLDVLLTLIERKMNELWKGEIGSDDTSIMLDEALKQRIIKLKKYYEESDYSWEEIKFLLLDSFGRDHETELFITSLK